MIKKLILLALGASLVTSSAFAGEMNKIHAATTEAIENYFARENLRLIEINNFRLGSRSPRHPENRFIVFTSPYAEMYKVKDFITWQCITYLDLINGEYVEAYTACDYPITRNDR